MTAMTRMSVGTCMCCCGTQCHIPNRWTSACMHQIHYCWMAADYCTEAQQDLPRGQRAGGLPRAGNLMRMRTPQSLRAWICIDVHYQHASLYMAGRQWTTWTGGVGNDAGAEDPDLGHFASSSSRHHHALMCPPIVSYWIPASLRNLGKKKKSTERRAWA